ncbi:MAG: SAM-dependent methyltransferase, partial [Sphingomicrobium sp.]
MSLIGRLIGSLLKSGQITIVMPDGKRQTFGPGGGQALTVRVTDRKVLFELMRNPRLAVGETYMDGRLIIEDGTILDLLELITSNNRWEEGGNNRKAIKKG